MRGRAGLVLSAVLVLTAPTVGTGVASSETPPPPEPPPISPTVCIDRLPEYAANLNAFFGGPVGMWQAGDVPHHYPLPDGRTLWILNDSFLSTTETASPLTTDSTFVHSAGFVQDDLCLTALNTLDADNHPQPFFADPGPGHWYWPLGGTVQGDHLLVFLAELSAPQPLTWALHLTARRVMVASFDWRTLTLESLQPAPDAGVGPLYGFSVASDSAYTYLFGNNLVYGDHTSATYVARVPIGQVGAAPYQYWNGSSWSASRATAQPVHDPGGYSYAMNNAFVAGRWYGITKVNEFFGAQIDILTAPDPTGPWTIGASVAVPTKPAAGQNTYNADLIGQLYAGGRVIISWSNNNFDYAPVAADPSLYRPTFADIQLPPTLLQHRTRSAASPAPPLRAI
jgi:hypothetical protein